MPKQQIISSFFKPQNTPTLHINSQPDVIQLSDSSDESNDDLPEQHQRPKKKIKLEQTTSRISSSPKPWKSSAVLTEKLLNANKTIARISTPLPTRSKEVTEAKGKGQKVTAPKALSNWVYGGQLNSSVHREPPSQEQLLRREAFTKKLLVSSRTLLERKSAYLNSEEYQNDGDFEAQQVLNGIDADLISEDEEDARRYENAEVEQDEKIEERKSQLRRFVKDAPKKAGSNSVKQKEKIKIKYTPLEQQVIELRKANPGVVLMIEVGYKYRFFEEDAQLASKVLGIAHFRSHSMLTASIPTHRLNVHIKRLISAGHKVGVVRQQETAALKKASDNRSAPFTRAVQHLYTSATYIDELALDPLETQGSATATLMCIVENEMPKEGRVRIGLLAVMPSTGEVVHDEFEDGHMRSELETRMLHLQPSELVLQKNMSRQTESMISYLAGKDDAYGGITCRVDRIPSALSVEKALNYVTNFYAAGKDRHGSTIGMDEVAMTTHDDLHEVFNLPGFVLVALAALVEHLKAFGLDKVFLHTHCFHHFSARATMSLNGNTLANLEILRNETDFTERGSLLSVVDHCKTSFGRRMLRKWVSNPLTSMTAVNNRLTAVHEIHLKSASYVIVALRELLRGLPDLERGLARIHFGRASPQELLRLLQAFERISTLFSKEEGNASAAAESLKSHVLKDVILILPKIEKECAFFLGRIDAAQARLGNKEDMWTDPSIFEALQDCKDSLSAVEDELQQELVKCQGILKKPRLEFVKIAQEEYLFEIRINEAKRVVPDNWIRINSTKLVYRYRSPKVQQLLGELGQSQERLAAEAENAFQSFLKDVSNCYQPFRAVTASVATIDCLVSFSVVASYPGYCRPNIVDTPGLLEIENGRHPMIEIISPQPFVANTVKLGAYSMKQIILTGLNMGGKSSLSRSIALIALMSQIGCYVPASKCTTSLFDGIYTRMGASDELARGRSTFMVELSETSEILKLATPRSLIILDELGRGTSTMDGQAIASAVLQYITRRLKSTCIFVTHYPSLSEVALECPDSISCWHMACLETKRTDGFSDVVFLYKLVKGLASRSHGLNVARMAELPDTVLVRAREKSEALEKMVKDRLRNRRTSRIMQLLAVLADKGGSTSFGESIAMCNELMREAV